MLMLIFVAVAACWLLFQVIRLSVRVAWGLTKFTAFGLCIVALPLLVLFAVSIRGAILLIPLLLLVGAWRVIKAA